MVERKVPEQFIKEFIKSLPKEFTLTYQQFYPILDAVLYIHIDNFFKNVHNIEEEKTRLRFYYSHIKRSFKKDVQDAFSNPDSKKRKILGPQFMNNKNNDSSLKLHEEALLDRVVEWSKNSKSLAYEFPLFTNLIKPRLEKALSNDILAKLIGYIETYYSGSKEFIFNKSTSYLISHAFFGDGINLDSHAHKESISVFQNEVTETDYFNNRISLFNEDDARIFNNLYNHTFSQLLSKKVVRMSISDLTYFTYGNRFTKNKNRVKERLLNMHRYGIRRSYYNDKKQHIEERIVFLPEVRVIEDHNSLEVEVEFSTTLRENLLTNLMVNYSSISATPEHHFQTKYSYLLLQLILEKRVLTQIEKTEDFSVDITYEQINEKIHFPTNIDLYSLLQPALEELKLLSEYLLDYRISNTAIHLKLKAITSDEILFIKDATSKINMEPT